PGAGDAAAHARIAELRRLIETMTRFHAELDRLETDRLIALLNMGAKLGKLAGGAGRLLPLRRRA
ncbi:MAG: GbsR/MarR family transcriptional regulator, partial [Rhodobacteraceae bacterium]|nr:GbsR/MarR family transcriptional regulator [Paracoccaceae bacterium]